MTTSYLNSHFPTHNDDETLTLIPLITSLIQSETESDVVVNYVNIYEHCLSYLQKNTNYTNLYIRIRPLQDNTASPSKYGILYFLGELGKIPADYIKTYINICSWILYTLKEFYNFDTSEIYNRERF